MKSSGAVYSDTNTGTPAARAPRFLFVFGVHRFRELRKSEDDFSFGRRGADREPSPGERFTAILKDGPGVGVHVITWCDSLTNLNRTFDRPIRAHLDDEIARFAECTGTADFREGVTAFVEKRAARFVGK